VNAAARWISIVAHPFVMTGVVIAAATMRHSQGQAGQSLLVGAAIIVPLAVLMVSQVRRGRWMNVDASRPSERPLLYAVALGAMAVTVGSLYMLVPGSFLLRGMSVMTMFMVVAGVLTRWVKVSMHVAFVALAATTLSLIGSWSGYVLIGVVPLMCWSRLALARHRPHELVAGCFLGVVTGALLV
jgi:hypothetical protein